MGRNHFFSLAFISWMVFVTFASLYSFEPDHGLSIEIPHVDKAVHFTFYFVAAILGLFAFLGRIRNGMGTGRLTFFMGLSLFIFGIIIEVIQHKYTSGRTGDVFDALANGLGALAGIWLVKLTFYSKKGLN